jgi:polysaccharide pyruvyl transferase CsaB
MKTVVLSGYYGYENIGDEALLASIISALKNQMPDLNIVVLSVKPGQTAERYGVEAADRLNLTAIINALKSCDLLISGGGSLLQDVTGPLSIPYYLGIVALAKMMGKPVMFYAQGIGPINKTLGKTLTRLVVNSVDMITLRDTASADLLRQLGVNRPPVEVTADPVFGLEADAAVDQAHVFASLGLQSADSPLTGIFVREWFGQQNYKKAVAGLADSLIEKGRQVLFVPMQHPVDAATACEIAGMMKNRPLVIDKGLGLKQVMALVKSMDIVVGMRLHALIIAALCAVPMVGISYDPKVAEFLDSIGQPGIKDIEAVTTDRLIDMVDDVIGNRENITKNLTEISAGLREKALRNSEIAARLLGQ